MRSRSKRVSVRLPTQADIDRLLDPAEIRSARLVAGLTQKDAGELVGGGERTWQDWERGQRAMPASARELFLIKTGQE